MNIVLFEPEIPQNTGNIGRLCVATNSRLHLIEPLGFELSDRYLKRAGLDYWQYVDLKIHPSLEAFYQSEALTPSEHFCLSKKADKLYTEVALTSSDYFMFGRETKGLPDEILSAYPERNLRIPIFHNGVRSLNLANSVSIIAYEAIRQTMLGPK
ncbi:MAG: tRNA (uridine(34)/cytosine(34)/5-carboxymethylaminomethyluridine(34)-2'-O)-methyltransferase TrmL [bacterium]|nr:tRNA (uridine(34)/cytosine(34)/5-carboxymethylaminomethyluridine(34)-2'-O)-methyltransferase TrmL [bacterium]